MIVFKRKICVSLILAASITLFTSPIAFASTSDAKRSSTQKQSSSVAKKVSKASNSKVSASKSSARVVKVSSRASSKAKPKSRSRIKPVVARQSSRNSMVMAQPTAAHIAGLHNVSDPLNLKSSAVLVADADTKELLYSKNPHAVLPIASITKLMTVVVSLEANLDLDEKVEITHEDMDSIKGTGSRLAPGSVFTRRELMHLALMASENRAAAALGRSYPGGMQACAKAMNEKARKLGMYSSNFVETTGLSASNQSSATDLAMLVMHANKFPLIRDYSTSPSYQVESLRGRELMFRNTNALIKKDHWDIQVQKTGFINEAGRCLVMQAKVGTRNLVIVLLDSVSKASRFSDAERIRNFVIQQ